MIDINNGLVVTDVAAIRRRYRRRFLLRDLLSNTPYDVLAVGLSGDFSRGDGSALQACPPCLTTAPHQPHRTNRAYPTVPTPTYPPCPRTLYPFRIRHVHRVRHHEYIFATSAVIVSFTTPTMRFKRSPTAAGELRSCSAYGCPS